MIQLSKSTLQKVEIAITNSWSPSTLQNYRYLIKKYLKFCQKEQILEHLQTPAQEMVLCAFAANDAGHYLVSTVKNRIAVLKAWHTANNWMWNGSEHLKCILNGVKNLSPPSATQTPQFPVNTCCKEMLCSYRAYTTQWYSTKQLLTHLLKCRLFNLRC
ncbi:hypothetical protein P691DRAFT_802212 [Macrolepiota fuliginosa MF-IS2]|uniref:Core-binding (CB) domain-containing protein n=1 Tax=Macrolepiota fuliginosa MF-IS2 TaxID=1400762 RepID=A0A9P5WXV4_9AGAR|nr:hypothetical protein P691DRAFT_802212 [Macrolepiota fuliginosa MF-IS2]